MFDSLDDQMKHDRKVESSTKERAFKYLTIAVLAVVLFAGLYFGLRLMEG